MGTKLHPPNHNTIRSMCFRAVPELLPPCNALVAVEEDKVTLFHITTGIHIATSVHHTLQKSLQKKLRAALFVVEAFNPCVCILAEENLEVQKKFHHVDRIVRADIPGQFAGNDFAVDGIGYRVQELLRD